jgi:hypothetical protein
MDGKLYFLSPVTKVEMEPAYREMRVYDKAKKTWSFCRKLPVWLENASAAVHEGKLLVKGAVMKEKNGSSVLWVGG